MTVVLLLLVVVCIACLVWLEVARRRRICESIAEMRELLDDARSQLLAIAAPYGWMSVSDLSAFPHEHEETE